MPERNYRFIGGSLHGQTRPVDTDKSTCEVFDNATVTPVASGMRWDAPKLTDRYTRRVLVAVDTADSRTANFSASEMVFVSEKLSEREARLRWIAMGFPKMDYKAPAMVRVDDSSLINAIGYDAASQVLDVELESGSTYRYEKVPAKTAWAFLAAESRGGFYNQHVKGRFASYKVAG